MSSDHHNRERSGSRRPIGQPSEHSVRGITRLVNPPEDDHEVIAPEEDPVEREYWGRILHVADRALRRRQDGESRNR